MLDEILNCLADSQNHTVSGVLAYLRSKCHSPIPSEKKVQFALAFLKEYGLVSSFTEPASKHFDVQEFWFLPKSVVEFWKQIKQLEK